MMTMLMIGIIVLSNAAGDVFITKGMKQIGEIPLTKPRRLWLTAGKVATNRNFLLGLCLLAVSFAAFLAVLSWEDMSFIVPATSVVYVVTILGARFILKEHIDGLRWLGTCLVCAGVALMCLP
ncbi:MAG TPA: EamA family transporter [Syntrophobacteraceae bacterium]|nr:EamA family transporter [Syntrophobacteraceae bacterium]